MPNYSIPTFVYVMAEADNGPFKLGISDHPSSRAKCVASATGLRSVRVFGQWYADRLARSIEMFAHEKLAAYSIGGEWFGFHALLGVEFMEKVAAELRLAEYLGEGLHDASIAAKAAVQKRLTRLWSDWLPVEYVDPGAET